MTEPDTVDQDQSVVLFAYPAAHRYDPQGNQEDEGTMKICPRNLCLCTITALAGILMGSAVVTFAVRAA